MSSFQGVSRVFHMQGFGSFLLHFTLRFGFPPAPPSFSAQPRPALPSVDPFFLYPLFTSIARIIPPSFFTPLFANHLASRSLRFLPVFLFLLFSSYSILLHFSVVSTTHQAYLLSFLITLSRWLSCRLILLLVLIFFSLSFPLFSFLKLSSLTYSNFLTFFFPLKLFRRPFSLLYSVSLY